MCLVHERVVCVVSMVQRSVHVYQNPAMCTLLVYKWIKWLFVILCNALPLVLCLHTHAVCVFVETIGCVRVYSEIHVDVHLHVLYAQNVYMYMILYVQNIYMYLFVTMCHVRCWVNEHVLIACTIMLHGYSVTLCTHKLCMQCMCRACGTMLMYMYM